MKRTLILASLLALAACAKPPQGEPATPPGATAAAMAETPARPAATSVLSAHHWRLTDAKDARGQRVESLFVNADKPLQLDFVAGRVGVSNTCNHMGGAYSMHGDQLKLEQMASTMMACADAKLMTLDQEAGKRLQGSTTFAQNGGTVTLTTAAGDVLTFKGQPTAETRYGGRGETVFLEVGPQTGACSHPMIQDMQCLQVRELKYDAQGIKTGATAAFQNFYADIAGYTHEPGIRSVLRVKRYPIRNPAADGGSLAYELDMLVESEKVQP